MAIMQAAEETGCGVILNYAEVHAPFLSMEQAALIMLDAAKKANIHDFIVIYLRYAGCIGGGL